MRRTLTTLVATAAALTALTACQPGQGPAGTVIARDDTYWSATKQWTYELTVRKADGTEHEFRVTRDNYKACGLQAAYPSCTKEH